MNEAMASGGLTPAEEALLASGPTICLLCGRTNPETIRACARWFYDGPMGTNSWGHPCTLELTPKETL